MLHHKCIALADFRLQGIVVAPCEKPLSCTLIVDVNNFTGVERNATVVQYFYFLSRVAEQVHIIACVQRLLQMDR